MKTFFNVYKNTFSFVLKSVFGGGCRFQPTCSEYAEEAFKVHGPSVGTFLSVKRVLKCHPFGGDGFDPVPPRIR